MNTGRERQSESDRSENGEGGGVMDKKMGGAVILTVIERKRRV